MKNLPFAGYSPLFVLILFISFFFSTCQKDLVTDQPISVQSREISIEELKAKYSASVTNERYGEKLPLYATPLWEDAYVVRTAEFPIILTPVDTPWAYPNTRHGGNLAFYKDPSGAIISILLIWEADSSSTYVSNKAPLDSASHFSGMIASVNQQDTIEKVTQVIDGKIVIAKLCKVAFLDAPDLDNGTGVNGRDPIEWFLNLFRRKVRCPSAAGGDDCWGAFWSWFSGLFEIENWDGPTGEYISYPPGTFFFGGGAWQFSWPEGYAPPGDGGVSDQQFSSQMSMCTAINEHVQSIGGIPQGYSQVDLDFCMLVNEAGVNGNQARCLYEQYGSTYVQELANYWNTSNKSVATAEKLRAYIEAKCTVGFSAGLLTDLIKQNFCLSQHPIDLMENIKNKCGFSSYENQEWYDDFNNGLSICVKEVIIDDWLDLSVSEKNYLLNNSTLFDNLVNFVKSKGCGRLEDESAKLFVEYVIEQLHTNPSILTNTNLGQYNFFDNYDSIINYLNSNTEPEDEINNGIEISYIIEAPPSPPSAGRLLGGSPNNPNGGQDAIARTNGDINILPPHIRNLDDFPEWDLKIKMETLFYIATHGDVDEILDGMGDEVSTAYLNKFFANKNGTFHKYQNGTLHLMVKESKKFKNWLKDFGRELNDKLKESNGSIGNISDIETDDRIALNDTKSLIILINDTQKTDVYNVNG